MNTKEGASNPTENKYNLSEILKASNKNKSNEGDSNSFNSVQTQENHEESEKNEKQINSILKRLKDLEDDNIILKSDVDNLKSDNAILKSDNAILKSDNAILKYDNANLKKRLAGIESLIIRNNINIDLLVNRDSLKTILLLFSINKNILTTTSLYKDLLGDYACKEKFSSLVLKTLKHLDSKLNENFFFRKGMTIQNPNNPEEIKKDFIFVEFIHFIVCTIDNLLHPSNQNTPKKFSTIIGKRALDTLSQGLKLFFANPKTISDLNKIIPIENNNTKKELDLDNYDNAKNTTYLINKSYYKILNKKNCYFNSFFIQYLFDPSKDNISQVSLAINYKEFNKKVEEILTIFKSKNISYDPIKLIENLKWN